ncbi:MAG: hypothetical protein LBQ15_05780 [Clostridium sp.]|jgi:hypothetical protein|nr:hypothetical protein [Clostridium sp.]
MAQAPSMKRVMESRLFPAQTGRFFKIPQKAAMPLQQFPITETTAIVCFFAMIFMFTYLLSLG